MLEILLASLPSLLPQDQQPAAPVAATAESRTAQWLPDTTLAALLIEPAADDSEFDALLAGPEFRTLAQQVAGLLQPVLGPLSAEDLAMVVRGGCAIAFVGFTSGQGPDVVFATNLGTAAPSLQERVKSLPRAGDLWRIPGAAGLLLGIREGHVAIGTDSATVVDTLSRAIEGTGATLATGRDFVRARGATNRPIAQVFLRLADLAESTLSHLPAATATTARRAIDVLGIADLHWASTTWELTGTELVARSQLEAPRVEGLIDALGGQPGKLDANLARFVPTGARTYGFFTMQIGTVFDELLALATAVQPMIGNAAAQQIDQVAARTGVDVRATLVGGLAGRMIGFATAGEHGFGLLLELRQGPSFERALTKLLEAMPTPLEAGTTVGVPCWRAPQTANGMQPSFAVVGSWLAFCSDDEALRTTVRQLQEPRADPQVLAFLRSLPQDATAAMASASTGAAAPAAGNLGQRHFVLRRSADGFASEERVDATALASSATATLAMLGAAPQPTATVAAADPTGDAEAATTLRDCESEGSTRANVTAVAALLTHAEREVVARACWLLGEWKAADAIVVLGDVARDHADADVRLQAVAALQRIGGTGTAQALGQATTDTDPRIRTLAVQALARLGAKPATSPTLALLDRFGSVQSTSVPDDLIAALVVLHDLGDPANLLPAATAIGYSQPQLGQALTFLFQGLSPHLPPKDEVATLLAVLDHKEPMLRRYAIQRLGELRDASTAAALEGRLAKESADLQPLIRVSLTQVRGDLDRGDDDLVARAKSNVAAISQMVERRWARLGTTGQIAVGATIGTLVLAAIGFVVVRRRARRSAAVAAAQSLVEPSAGYAASGRGDRYQPTDAELPLDDEQVGAESGNDTYGRR